MTDPTSPELPPTDAAVDSEADALEPKAETPDASNPATEADAPAAKGDDPGAKGDDPGPKGDDPGAKGDDPGAKGDDPGAKGDDPGAKGDDPGAKGDDPGAKGDDPAAPAEDEPASLLPLILIVGLVLIGLMVSRWTTPSQADSETTPDQLIIQGNRQPSASEAIPFFERAIEMAPDHPQAHAALGRAYAMRNEFGPALEHLVQARDLSTTPVPPDVHMLIGMSFLGLERFEEAFLPLLAARELNPDDYRAGYYLAMASRFLGRHEETAEYLRGILDHPRLPDPSLPYRWYVEAMDELQRPDQAIAALTSLTTMRPQDIGARQQLLQRRMVQDGFEATVAGAQEAAAAGAAGAYDHYVLAWLLAKDPNRAAEAREAYEATLVLDSGLVWALAGLAREDLRDGDLATARQRLEQAIHAEPGFADGLERLALVKRLGGDCQGAREIYHSLQAKGSAGVARDGVLDSFLEEGRLDDASTYAADLVKDLPPEHPGRVLEARVLQAKGDFAAAREALTRIHDGLPESDHHVWKLRRALWALEAGDIDAAQADFQALLAEQLERREVLLLWAGVAQTEVDPESARALWAELASSGRALSPTAFATIAGRRLAGQVGLDELLRAARLDDMAADNDAWYCEGLARELAGDVPGAKEAYAKSLEATRGVDFPARLAQRSLDRLGE